MLLFATAAFASCERAEEKQEPERVAGQIVRVGETVLAEVDLENLLPEGERIPFTTEEKKRFVQRWVDAEVLYQEAARRGLKDDPRIQARLRSLEQEFLADHLTFLELRERTTVTDEEVMEYFREHEEEYRYEYKVSHILVNTLEEAEEVKDLLNRNSFSWVANRYSIDPVARRGGNLGYLTKGNMIPEFEKVIFDMEPGEVSDIVKSDFGYHIIKLIGARESLVQVGLGDVREQIMNNLMIEKRKKAYGDFLDALRSVADIEYYEQAYTTDSVTESGVDTAGSGEQGDTARVEEDDR